MSSAQPNGWLNVNELDGLFKGTILVFPWSEYKEQCFMFFKHNGTLLRMYAVAQRKLHCQNPTVSWNYAHLQQQPHNNIPFKTRCTTLQPSHNQSSAGR
jgi:hypothetical protein